MFNHGFCDDRTFHKRRERYKAGCYVSESWGFHIRQAKLGDSDDRLKTVLAILAFDNKRSSMLQVQNHELDKDFIESQTLLHVIAQEGLVTICKLALKLPEM